MVTVNLKETIYDLEISLLSPKIRASVHDLNLLLADDFKEFGSSGKIYSKKDILECLPNDSAAESIEYSISNFDIQSLAEHAVSATYTLDKIYPDNNRVTSLRSSLWKQSNENGWQMLFHQGTCV